MNEMKNGYKVDGLPLVSAVITTHNRLDYLKLAIKSVLNQTYQNMELIVVNDNSGQDTIDYLDELQEQLSGFTHIDISAEETKGGNYARNQGIKAAKGKYVAFLDDDDEWLPEKIEKQIKLFREGVGFVYCGKYNEINDGVHEKYVVEKKVDATYLGDLSQLAFTKIFCVTSAMVIEKAVLEEIGGFDEDLRFWQETELCIRVCQVTKVDAVKEQLVFFRINVTDSNRLTNKYDGWIEAVEQINRKHRKLIDQLPEEYKKQRQLMILQDKIGRLETCDRLKEARKIRYEKWKITKDTKDLLRYILNRSIIIDKNNKLSGGGTVN